MLVTHGYSATVGKGEAAVGRAHLRAPTCTHLAIRVTHALHDVEQGREGWMEGKRKGGRERKWMEGAKKGGGQGGTQERERVSEGKRVMEFGRGNGDREGGREGGRQGLRERRRREAGREDDKREWRKGGSDRGREGPR